MYQSRHLSHNSSSRGRRAHLSGAMLLSLLILVFMAVGGTVAYLFASADPVQNKFTPSHVSCSVTEQFNGTTKENVNVVNTGDTEAYIRVKLVSYQVNEQGLHIGGTAPIPEFAPGANWVRYGEYYYYTLPVAPSGGKPAADLIDSISFTGAYSDADGGKQVIEVMAEAIQSVPTQAVGTAWGVSISEGSVAAYSGT